MKEILYILFGFLLGSHGYSQIDFADARNLKELRKAHINELMSSENLDCSIFAVSLEFYPAFAFSDSALSTSKIGSSLESPFNLASTVSKVWTRRIYLGIGTGISNEGQLNFFLDFKYAPYPASISPLLTFQSGGYWAVKDEDFIPYISPGFGIRQRVFNWNYFDFHLQYQERFKTKAKERNSQNFTHFMLVSFRFTWLIV